MPTGLQSVLRVQLLRAGDVSAVTKTPGGFFLHVCKERTESFLSTASRSWPKRDYEQWLNENIESP